MFSHIISWRGSVQFEGLRVRADGVNQLIDSLAAELGTKLGGNQNSEEKGYVVFEDKSPLLARNTFSFVVSKQEAQFFICNLVIS